MKEEGDNMNKKILIEANRNGYSTDQCGKTITAGELIGILTDYDENTPVYISNDNGYTYGNISWSDVFDKPLEDNDDEENWEE